MLYVIFVNSVKQMLSSRVLFQMSEIHVRKLLWNKSKEVELTNKNDHGMFKYWNLHGSKIEHQNTIQIKIFMK